MTANDNRALKGYAIDALRTKGIEAEASDSGSNVISAYVTKTQFDTMRREYGIDARYARTIAGRYWVLITLTQRNRRAIGV